MRQVLFVVFAVLVVTIAGVYALFMRDMAAARARLAGRSQTLETSFGTLEYAVRGEGEPMLAVHGAAGGFDQALDMTGAVADRGYRLIAPSRFGYLRSTLPAGPTTAMQADAFVQLLDHLGVGKVDLVGISAGAWSSIEFAFRHPERCRALVLLVPSDYLPPGTSIHGGALAKAIFNSDFVAWAVLKLMPAAPDRITRMMLGTDAAIVRSAEPSEKTRLRQILDHLLPVSLRSEGMQFDVQTASTHQRYPIEKIACPVLAISAEDDRFGTASRARFIAASVRNGRAIIFPTGGHALVGEYSHALHEAISFLQAAPE